MYNFGAKLKQGQGGEAYLDNHFSEWYAIKEASGAEQRKGIDRWFTAKAKNSKPFSVEYKTDWTAGRTGNAFVETVSVDTAGKRGWAYTSESLYLIYYIPDPETIYVLPMASIRSRVDQWKKQYPERRIPNKGYFTIGALVPLDEFERLAVMVT